MENLINFLQNSNISYTQNIPLSPLCTFKVGGNAQFFIAPATFQEFQTILIFLNENKIHHFILGGGSNIVFPDEEFHGAVISTQNLNSITSKQLENNQVLVTCSCGTSIASFINYCIKNNISGAENFAGLPGTIGGAVYMNARCFEKSISDILFSTTHIEADDFHKMIEKPFDSSEWNYKHSPFQKTETDSQKFILQASFLLNQKTAKSHSEIDEACKKFIKNRISKGHFKYPSAGSVFKNNHEFGKPSGKIIDEANLKGYTIGGAQIAPFHGNFIININNAKASDIKQLVEYTKKIVYEKFSFSLECEIIFVDNKL